MATFVGLLAIVGPHVDHQFVFSAEGPLTLPALEGLLTRVGQLMSLQVLVVNTAIGAQLAMVFFHSCFLTAGGAGCQLDP